MKVFDIDIRVIPIWLFSAACAAYVGHIWATSPSNLLNAGPHLHVGTPKIFASGSRPYIYWSKDMTVQCRKVKVLCDWMQLHPEQELQATVVNVVSSNSTWIVEAHSDGVTILTASEQDEKYKSNRLSTLAFCLWACIFPFILHWFNYFRSDE